MASSSSLGSILLLVFVLAVSAVGSASAAAGSDSSPSKVQVQRAEKITSDLTLNDSAQRTRVRDLIAAQYFQLSLVHATRDAAIKAAKENANSDHAKSESAIAQARTDAEAAQNKLHTTFLAALEKELSPPQIDQVKNGMTYGVLPLTFGVYQKMLPQLTEEQKQQILAWLTEAREHAMDASTSEEKHAWFGKYKGRINNYLTKAGYDMKAAEKNLTAHP